MRQFRKITAAFLVMFFLALTVVFLMPEPAQAAATPATVKLTKVENTASGVKITWDKAANAETYRVYRKTSGTSWGYLKTVSATNYTDTSAKAGTTYIYTVKGMNGSKAGGYNKTGLTIKRLATPVIGAVNETEGVVITWKKIAGANSYRIYRRVPGEKWGSLTDVASAELSYTDTSAVKGVTYDYTVKALSGKYYSASADSVSLTRKIPPCATHTWGSGRSVQRPTCAKEGIVQDVCTVCGATRTRHIAKTSNHSWDSGKITTAATCSSNGIRTYTCKVCGTTKKESVAKTGHTYGATQSYTAGTITQRCTKCNHTIESTGNIYKVTSPNLKVRKGAGTGYSQIGEIKKDELYTVLSTQYIGTTTWGRITYNCGVGWVSLQYMTCIRK